MCTRVHLSDKVCLRLDAFITVSTFIFHAHDFDLANANYTLQLDCEDPPSITYRSGRDESRSTSVCTTQILEDGYLAHTDNIQLE